MIAHGFRKDTTSRTHHVRVEKNNNYYRKKKKKNSYSKTGYAIQLGIGCVSNRDVTVIDKDTSMCRTMLDQTPENSPHCHIISYNGIKCTCNN